MVGIPTRPMIPAQAYWILLFYMEEDTKMANKQLNVRIVMRNAATAEWNESQLV